MIRGCQLMLLLMNCVVFLFGAEVWATSCRPLKKTLVAQCDQGSCTKVFYVREIRTQVSYCARKVVMSSPPDWGQQVLEFEIKHNNLHDQSLTAELGLTSRRWVDPIHIYSLPSYIDTTRVAGGKNAIRVVFKVHDFDSYGVLRQNWILKEHWQHGDLLHFQVLRFFYGLALLLITLVLVVWQVKAVTQRDTGALFMGVLIWVLMTLLIGSTMSGVFIWPILLVVLIPGLLLFSLVAWVFLESTKKTEQ